MAARRHAGPLDTGPERCDPIPGPAVSSFIRRRATQQSPIMKRLARMIIPIVSSRIGMRSIHFQQTASIPHRW
jgi:hypothetical protein